MFDKTLNTPLYWKEKHADILTTYGLGLTTKHPDSLHVIMKGNFTLN